MTTLSSPFGEEPQTLTIGAQMVERVMSMANVPERQRSVAQQVGAAALSNGAGMATGDGNIAVVTGAGHGIGRALAARLVGIAYAGSVVTTGDVRDAFVIE